MVSCGLGMCFKIMVLLQYDNRFKLTFGMDLSKQSPLLSFIHLQTESHFPTVHEETYEVAVFRIVLSIL